MSLGTDTIIEVVHGNRAQIPGGTHDVLIEWFGLAARLWYFPERRAKSVVKTTGKYYVEGLLVAGAGLTTAFFHMSVGNLRLHM